MSAHFSKQKNTKEQGQPPLSIPEIQKFPKYNSAKRLQARIDFYFSAYIVGTNLHPNIAGLARFLGFGSKEELREYMEHPPRKSFGDVLKKARLKIEELVLDSAQRNNIGSMFYSKAEFGYTEKNILEIESPPGISKEDQERLRKVSDLWERERRRELGAKVQDIKKLG